jgi:hypothetical protein
MFHKKEWPPLIQIPKGHILFCIKNPNHSNSIKRFSETDIIKMLEFLIDNIFATFGGRVFQQTACIPMDTNCAPLRTSSFIRMTQTSYRGFVIKSKRR